MKKRILSMMLAIAMVLSMLSGIALTSSAADDAKVYTLVTDASTLAAGDEIIFVSAEADNGVYNAMTAYVSGNNVKVAAVDVAGETATVAADSTACPYILGGEADAWTFFDGTNYLHNDDLKNNRLKAKAELDDYCKWIITITDGATAITNAANTTKGVMQYNAGSDLFSCYGSASQKGINIYKLAEGVTVCTHPNATSVETVVATCTENGELTWTCPDCNESWTEATAKADHINEEVVTKEPTCETTGTKTLTCTVCGSSIERTIDALGHNYVEGTCTNCGEAEPADKSFVRVENASDLTAGDEIIFVSAEAIEDGSYFAMLKYVSGNNVKAVAVIPAENGSITATSENGICVYTLGGEAGAWTFFDGTNYLYAAGAGKNLLQAQATLEDNGYWTIEIAEGLANINNVANTTNGWMRYNSGSKLFSCYAPTSTQKDLVIYKLSDGTTEPTPTCKHENATSEQTVAPTCTEAGELTWTCADCGETWTEAVPALGHTNDEGVVTTEPTCTTSGVKTYTCTVCGETTTEEIPALGHTNDEGVVTTEPTCEVAGVKTYTCTVCGSQKTYSIPALGHTYENGFCTTCGAAEPGDKSFALVTDIAELKAGDEIIFVSAEAAEDGSYYAMLTYVSGNNVKAVAVVPAEDGTITATSENGIGVYTLGGEAGAWTFANGANYLYTSGTGKNQLQAKAELDEYGYWTIDMVEGVLSITNNGNTSRGTMQFNYSASSQLFACYSSASQKAIAIYKLVSGTTEPDPTPCTHENATSEVTTAATCEAEGVLTFTCECGETWTEVIPALGHAYTSEVTTAATCEAAGVLTYTCANCGGTYTEEIPALGHNYVDGTCTNCGDTIVVAPTVDESIKIFHTLDLASDISISFVVLQSALANYESFYLECVLPEYEGNEQVGTSTVEIQPELKGTRYYFTLTGITAVRMGDMVDAVLHMTKADGTQYISNTDTYGVSTYAYAMLNSSSDAKMLALCADLLRYGAEAQSFKGYRTDALVDAAMTEEQRAYLSDTEALTFTATDSLLGDVEAPTVTWLGKTLDLGSKVGMKFVFNTSNYTGDVANLTMKVSYEGSTGEIKTVTLTGPEAYGTSGTLYSFTFYGLLASELRTVVEVAVFDGETQVLETLRYSAESYASKAPATLVALTRALFAYSDSAKAYFTK